MKCTTCRSQCRKTTTVYVDTDNGLKRARVCNVCVTQTVRLFMGDAPTLCSCGEPATTCQGCADKRRSRTRLESFSPVLERIKGMAVIAHNTGNGGRAGAFQQAADIIEAEAKRNA